MNKINFLKVASIYFFVSGIILIIVGFLFEGSMIYSLVVNINELQEMDPIAVRIIIYMFGVGLAIIIFGIFCLIMGILGLKNKKRPEKAKRLKKLGIIGIILSVLVLVISFLSVAWYVEVWIFCCVVMAGIYYYGALQSLQENKI